METTLNVWKKELEENINKSFRDIQTDIQRITNIKYNRQMKHKGMVGGFKGFRIKDELIDCMIE